MPRLSLLLGLVLICAGCGFSRLANPEETIAGRAPGAPAAPLAAASCPTPGAAIIPCLNAPMPTNWWPGDVNANDVVGSKHAELRKGAQINTPGIHNKGFRLSGKRYVRVADDPALNFGTGDFTLSLWVRFKKLDQEMVLAEKWQPSSDPHGWTLTKLASDALRFASGGGGVGPEEIDTAPIGFQTATWYHVAVTRASGMLTIYVNGLPRACAPCDKNLNRDVPLSFGHRGPDEPGAKAVQGSIDEVKLWVGTALDPAAVKELWALAWSGATPCAP